MSNIYKINGAYYYAPKQETPPVNYLWMTPHHNETVPISLISKLSPYPINISYKIDDGEWSNYTIGDIIELNYGQKVYWKGNNDHFSMNAQNYYKFSTSTDNYAHRVDIGGDLTTLLSEQGNVLDISGYGSRMFNQLFRALYEPDGCFVYDASQLILPSTTLGDYCYSNMFACQGNGSTGASLIYAPELPATTLTDHCYNYMFSGQVYLTSIKLHYTGYFSNGLSSFLSWTRSINTEGILYYNGPDTSRGNDAIPNYWTVQTF